MVFAGPAVAAQVVPAGTAEVTRQQASDGGLGEIIVTARQRKENMQDTPMSIAAVGGAALSNMGVNRLTDLDAKVPSLQFGNAIVRLNTFTGIRGVGDYSRNPGYDNRAGVYLDGVLMGRSAATDYPIFDLEQVEVLRGPQGTLFGKDALTGVINITTVKPKFTDEMQAKLSVGSRSLISGGATVNTALSDTVAIRVSVNGQSQRGYYRNKFDNSWVGGGTIFAGRGQIRWKAGESTTVDLNFDGVHDDADALIGGTPVTGPGVAFTDGGRDFSQNKATKRQRKILGTGLTINHEMGDFTLTSISAYRTSTSRITGLDFDLSPQEQGSDNLYDKSHAFSQEVRLASPGASRFNYVVGLFYYNQVASSDWHVTSGPDFPASLALRDQARVPTQIIAGFGHATWKPLDFVTVDGGARVGYTHKAIRFSQTSNGALGFINLPNYRDKINETDVSPMASVTLSPTNRIHVYGTFSTGKRPGGWNADIIKTSNLKFGSESGQNYEIGTKTELFDRHLRLNVSAYIMKFRNFQVTQLVRDGTTVVPTLTNAGHATSKGIEADFDAALFRGFNLMGGASYSKAIYDRFRNGGGVGVNYDGNTLIEAPRWTASGTASYTHPVGENWKLGGSLTYTYKGKTYADPSNLPQFEQDPQHLLNGEIGIGKADDGFRVAVFGRNLANVTYRVTNFATALNYRYYTLNEPRVIGLELSIKR